MHRGSREGDLGAPVPPRRPAAFRHAGMRTDGRSVEIAALDAAARDFPHERVVGVRGADDRMSAMVTWASGAVGLFVMEDG